MSEPADPRRRLYGLTADEWLHLAAEGDDSEVGPCCANIAALRDWLNVLATEQSAAGPPPYLASETLAAYETACTSHPQLANPLRFPLLAKVVAAVAAQLGGSGGCDAATDGDT